MTKFETIGSDRQYAAKSIEEAKCEKDISCYACVRSPRALYSDCRTCQIRLAHEYMLAALQDAARKDGVA